MTKPYTLPTCRCLRCGHEWTPRQATPAKVCPNPKCKSPYWQTPRRKDRAAVTA